MCVCVCVCVWVSGKVRVCQYICVCCFETERCASVCVGVQKMTWVNSNSGCGCIRSPCGTYLSFTAWRGFLKSMEETQKKMSRSLLPCCCFRDNITSRARRTSPDSVINRACLCCSLSASFCIREWLVWIQESVSVCERYPLLIWNVGTSIPRPTFELTLDVQQGITLCWKLKICKRLERSLSASFCFRDGVRPKTWRRSDERNLRIWTETPNCGRLSLVVRVRVCVCVGCRV